MKCQVYCNETTRYHIPEDSHLQAQERFSKGIMKGANMLTPLMLGKENIYGATNFFVIMGHNLSTYTLLL